MDKIAFYFVSGLSSTSTYINIPGGLCGVLPQGSAVGEIPGAGLTGGST